MLNTLFIILIISFNKYTNNNITYKDIQSIYTNTTI